MFEIGDIEEKPPYKWGMAMDMRANTSRGLENAEMKIIPVGVGCHHLLSYSNSGVLRYWAKCAQEFSGIALVFERTQFDRMDSYF